MNKKSIVDLTYDENIAVARMEGRNLLERVMNEVLGDVTDQFREKVNEHFEHAPRVTLNLSEMRQRDPKEKVKPSPFWNSLRLTYEDARALLKQAVMHELNLVEAEKVTEAKAEAAKARKRRRDRKRRALRKAAQATPVKPIALLPPARERTPIEHWLATMPDPLAEYAKLEREARAS